MGLAQARRRRRQVRALRYARNSVHHDWAQAIDLPPRRRQLPARQTIFAWEWVPELPPKKPRYARPDDEREYRTQLAGKCVAVTLMELDAAAHYLADYAPDHIDPKDAVQLGPRISEAA